MSIEGKVAAIVSIREVAINRGRNHGVEEGMVFAVLAETPVKVKDPDTNKVILELDREKVRVKVTEVNDEACVASTFQTETTPGILGFPTFPLQLYPSSKMKTLRVEDSDLPAPLPENQSYVKRGDRARQVTEVTPE